MKLPSGTTRGKRLADGGKAFLGKWGRRAWKIVKPGANRVWDVCEALFKRVERACEQWIPRFAAKWTDHGLPIAVLQLAVNALLFVPVDIGWYLLASVGHGVRLNLPFLLVWLVFAGSVRASLFYCKKILPNQRAAHRLAKGKNEKQIEGGC